MTTSLTLEIGQLLHQPIDPTLLKFRPQNPRPRAPENKEGSWYCLALGYYEIWDLVNVLNRYVYAQWRIVDQQTLFSEYDNRVIVWLVLEICGVQMAGVGEEFLNAETQTDENAVTSAWAQALKRACALFGLGLGAYFFPLLKSRYVEYDRKTKKISVSQDTLLKLARELYARTPDPLLRGLVGAEGQDLSSLEALMKTPFPPDQIEFLPQPGSRRQEQDGSWVCEANPYVEVWTLVRRLNAIAYGYWSVPRVVIGIARNTAIVTVWVKVGEECQPGVWQEPLTVMDQQTRGNVKPIADVVTTAYSYAFKRACHLLGLSLYLRFLPPPTVRMEGNRIAPFARDIAITLYRKAGLPLTTHAKPTAVSTLTSTAESAPSDEEYTQAAPSSAQELRTQVWNYLQHDQQRVQALCVHYQVETFDMLSNTQIADLHKRLLEWSRPGTAMAQQMKALRQFCEHLKEPVPEQAQLSYNGARARILMFSARCQQKQATQAHS